MKNLFARYAGYNEWANQQLANIAAPLSEDLLKKTVNSSFPSIYHTFLHMWSAEAIWYQRVKMKENIEIPFDEFSGNIEEMFRNLMAQSRVWKEWVSGSTEAALQHEFIYRNSKKEQFKQPVAEVLLHLFNHQAYHRGQLITLFRQAGITKIPSTDLVIFLRKHK